MEKSKKIPRVGVILDSPLLTAGQQLSLCVVPRVLLRRQPGLAQKAGSAPAGRRPCPRASECSPVERGSRQTPQRRAWYRKQVLAKSRLFLGPCSSSLASIPAEAAPCGAMNHPRGLGNVCTNNPTIETPSQPYRSLIHTARGCLGTSVPKVTFASARQCAQVPAKTPSSLALKQQAINFWKVPKSQGIPSGQSAPPSPGLSK